MGRDVRYDFSSLICKMLLQPIKRRSINRVQNSSVAKRDKIPQRPTIAQTTQFPKNLRDRTATSPFGTEFTTCSAEQACPFSSVAASECVARRDLCPCFVALLKKTPTVVANDYPRATPTRTRHV